MKAAVVEALDRSPRYAEFADPVAGDGEVRVKVLRSSGLELLGSGFGSASLDEIIKPVSEMFAEAAREPFESATKAAPLREIDSEWNLREHGTRLVFVP